MKYLLFLVLIFVSCKRSGALEEEVKFKEYVGLQDYVKAVSLLHFMEQKLVAEYGVEDINSIYERYLHDRSTGHTRIPFTEADCEKSYAFEESGLLNKYCQKHFDEVFLEDDGVVLVSDGFEGFNFSYEPNSSGIFGRSKEKWIQGLGPYR